jgi:hypothetical protein
MPLRTICEAWKNPGVKGVPAAARVTSIWRALVVHHVFSLFLFVRGSRVWRCCRKKSLDNSVCCQSIIIFLFSYFLYLSRFFSFSLFSFTFEEKTIESARVLCIVDRSSSSCWASLEMNRHNILLYIRNNRDEHIKREKSKPNHQYIL